MTPNLIRAAQVNIIKAVLKYGDVPDVDIIPLSVTLDDLMIATKDGKIDIKYGDTRVKCVFSVEINKEEKTDTFKSLTLVFGSYHYNVTPLDAPNIFSATKKAEECLEKRRKLDDDHLLYRIMNT